MKKIIIFTKYSRLKSVSEDLRTLKGIPLIKENFFIVLNEATQLFQVSNSINDGQIFLAKDDIKLEDLSLFIGAYDKKMIGILKHRMPDESSKIKFSEFKKCEGRGQHESKGKFYPDVLKIITDDDKLKFPRLQKVIFRITNKEEAKNKLVNDITYYNTTPTVIDEAISEFQFALDSFISELDALEKEERMNFKSENFMKAYNKFLNNLQHE